MSAFTRGEYVDRELDHHAQESRTGSLVICNARFGMSPPTGHPAQCQALAESLAYRPSGLADVFTELDWNEGPRTIPPEQTRGLHFGR